MKLPEKPIIGKPRMTKSVRVFKQPIDKYFITKLLIKKTWPF
jgi:hypothetical protein